MSFGHGNVNESSSTPISFDYINSSLAQTNSTQPSTNNLPTPLPSYSLSSNMRNKSTLSSAGKNSKTKGERIIIETDRHFEKRDGTRKSVPIIAHKGSLKRNPNINSGSPNSSNKSDNSLNMLYYTVEISYKNDEIKLYFDRLQYERITRLFSIIDTESKGVVTKDQVKDFVSLRCPVFQRRDDLLQRLEEKSLKTGASSSSSSVEYHYSEQRNHTLQMHSALSHSSPFSNLLSSTEKRMETIMKRIESSGLSPPRMGSNGIDKNFKTKSYVSTFDEVWNNVIASGVPYSLSQTNDYCVLGIEGFAIFCRFIALAQYLEAKQRFSQRHLQQTKHWKNGDSLVMVEVPPLSAPGPLSLVALKEYEESKFKSGSLHPFPELDLNHCLVASHDDYHNKRSKAIKNSNVPSGKVIVSLFGHNHVASNSPSYASTSVSSIESYDSEEEYVVTFCSGDGKSPTSVVRRTASDMEWLHETISSHQVLGGTLSGRILPPFPKIGSSSDTSVLPSIFKSIWGSITTASSSKSGESGSNNSHSQTSERNARHLERCLNFLLEHPALFTSFPLNAVLKASQTGLDAAKRILDEETSSNANRSVNPFSSNDPNKPISPLAPSSDLSWVRSAAQAAMALKLHGILDATGYASASARLQHASLPVLDTSRSHWRGDNQCSSPPPSLESSSDGKDDTEAEDQQQLCFENGVISIESELDDDNDDYDLLPSPTSTNPNIFTPSHTTEEVDSKRFYYGPPYHESVDADIDKLREIIGNVHSTLSRSSVVCKEIGDATKLRGSYHLSIVRGLDSWIALRGHQLMSERALLNALSSIESCNEKMQAVDSTFYDHLSWHASLASSAVTATKDMRSAVEASRVATGAKEAAQSAAVAAQKAYEQLLAPGSQSRPEDIRIARTRASITHSHAIYAAVIQYEAFSAKRKAALALAHDVKFWNQYRKRELLKACINTAKVQKEAVAKSKESWSLLLTGLFGPKSNTATDSSNQVKTRREFKNLQPVSTSISCPEIIPVNHVALSPDQLQHRILSAIEETNKKSNDNKSLCTYENSKNEHDASMALNVVRQQEPIEIVDNHILGNTSAIASIASEKDAIIKSLSSSSINEISHLQNLETNTSDMTASMQSLVDGLLNWGISQGHDIQDDLSLPNGMAVSIALEETNAAACFNTETSQMLSNTQ